MLMDQLLYPVMTDVAMTSDDADDHSDCSTSDQVSSVDSSYVVWSDKMLLKGQMRPPGPCQPV